MGVFWGAEIAGCKPLRLHYEMLLNLADGGVVLRAFRTHLYDAAIWREQEVVSYFFLIKTHRFGAAVVHGGVVIEVGSRG